MRIVNFLPMTLIDYPNHVTTIIFTQGCNLRCPYCHNPQLVLSQSVDTENRIDDFKRFLIKRKSFLDGVVISGGEPLVQNDIVEFISEIKDMGLKVKIDTNGFESTALERIIANGMVDYVALDFKNEFPLLGITCGINDSKKLSKYREQWKKSITVLRKSTVIYELRTTVVKEFHSLETLMTMAKSLNDNERWYIQSFKRSTEVLNDYEDNTDLRWSLSSYVEDELLAIVNELKKVHKQTIIR